MLQRPWLTPMVVLFWCLTNGWLVCTKIVPSLSRGSPPGYQVPLTDGGLDPVAWSVLWNDRPLGWALAESRRSERGGVIIDSRMRFEHLPLDEILPAWVPQVTRTIGSRRGNLSLDAHSRVTIDEGGGLRSFLSSVSVPWSTEALMIRGEVEGGMVRIHVQAGDVPYETSRHLPDHLTLGDELSPQATMPGLYEGRRWTAPVYNPLRTGRSPIEILHAEVGAEETIYWAGQLVRTHPVSYRADAADHHEPRCRLWVDRSGRVLRQEVALLGARLGFVRRSDDQAAHLAASLAEDVRGPGSLPDDAEEKP